MSSDLNPSKRTVLAIMADLANGLISSRELIEAALAQIADPAGEGARTFVKVYGDSARAVADAQDRLRKAGYIASPLAGLPVSLKDLFDVSGERTLAGSKALRDGQMRGNRRLSDAPLAAHNGAYARELIFRRSAAVTAATRPTSSSSRMSALACSTTGATSIPSASSARVASVTSLP
jgi:hypothetical protein